MSNAFYPQSSVAWTPAYSSGHTSPSVSTERTRQHGRAPSNSTSPPYYADERINLAEAFADVNRALGRRAARQSIVVQTRPSAALPPKSVATEPLRILKKSQTPENVPRLGASKGDPRLDEDHRRFSTASAPIRSCLSVTPVQRDSYSRPQETYNRGVPMNHEITNSRRPALRVVIPPSPAERRAQRAHARHHASVDMRSKPSVKEQSGCVVM